MHNFISKKNILWNLYEIPIQENTCMRENAVSKNGHAGKYLSHILDVRMEGGSLGGTFSKNVHEHNFNLYGILQHKSTRVQSENYEACS